MRALYLTMTTAAAAAAAAAVFVSATAGAETIPMKQKMRGSMTGGLDNCRTEIVAQAQISAVREVAEHLSGRSGGETEAVAQQAADCCVAAVKVLRAPRDRGTGQCEATVLVRVDEQKVKTALKQANIDTVKQGRPTVVGAVIRFVVDGKPADGSRGYNPQEALVMLQSELTKYGYRLVNLSALMDDFALRRFGQDCDIDGVETRDCRSFEGYADAVQTVIDRTRWAARNDIPDVRAFREDGGWIAIGEVAATQTGRDPEGIRFRADVVSAIRLFRIEDGATRAVDITQLGGTTGDRQEIAVRSVMMDGIGDTADKLARALADGPAS